MERIFCPCQSVLIRGYLLVVNGVWSGLMRQPLLGYDELWMESMVALVLRRV